jgi:hypothetical protein
MDVLVLSPCSKSKHYDPVLDCETADVHSREELVQKHLEQVTTVAEMYTGREHQQVKNAVSSLSEIATVDWYIISAGFGLLHEEAKIPLYECTFNDIESVRTRAERAGHDVDQLTNDETIQAVGREKGIPQEFIQVLNEGHDLLFVVLSEPYLISITEALTKIPDSTTAVAFASNGSKQYIKNYQWIPATETEQQALGTTMMQLRGELFRRFAASTTTEELRSIRGKPSLLIDRLP